jgi:hypothetical protein
MSRFIWLEHVRVARQVIVVSMAKAVSARPNPAAAYVHFAVLFNRLTAHFNEYKYENVSLTLADYVINTENNDDELTFIKNIIVR